MASWFLRTAILVVLDCASVFAADYEDVKVRCVLCHDMRQAKEQSLPSLLENCLRLGACDLDTRNCSQYCGEVADVNTDLRTEAESPKYAPSFRFSKGFGPNGYDKIRVSVITNADEKPPDIGRKYDYSHNFKYVWQTMALHTVVVDVKDELDISGMKVKVAPPGSGVAGLYFGDPCYADYSSPITILGCAFSTQWKTKERTPKILDAFLKHDDLDYWALLGDNWYDRTGQLSRDVYSQLSPESLAKLFVTVPGNHDFWNCGVPQFSTNFDQCGLGFLQYFPMDVVAGKDNRSNPYIIVDPFKKHYWGCDLPDTRNFVWYHQLGNIGLFGYDGANLFSETKPYLEEACKWFGKQPNLDVLMMMTHWDVPNLGCNREMDGTKVFHIMGQMPGCKKFLDKNNFKFYTGHTHCNRPHPHGNVGMGFQVAGQGMRETVCDEGTYNYGFSVFDTTGNRLRSWFFWLADSSGADKFDAVYACIKELGWRRCTKHATLWLDQPLDRTNASPELIET